MAAPADPREHDVAMVGAMDDSESRRMAARLVKFGISLAFYTLSESWRMLRRVGGGTAAPNAVVIYYHHVLADQRARFSRQLDHLLRYSEPLSSAQREPLRPDTRYSMVTADDGWKSFADHGLPEIERRNIPVTIFAISQRLGQSVDGITFDRLLSADELRAFDAKLVTVGSHTATHAKMSALDERDALRELRESRDQLSAIVGREVTMFCFPYGAYREDLIPLCRQAGYDRVFTCMPELADPARFVLGRVRVDPTDWPLEFHLKLMGAYRWLPMAIALKRRFRPAFGGGSQVPDQSPEIPAS